MNNERDKVKRKVAHPRSPNDDTPIKVRGKIYKSDETFDQPKQSPKSPIRTKLSSIFKSKISPPNLLNLKKNRDDRNDHKSSDRRDKSDKNDRRSRDKSDKYKSNRRDKSNGRDKSDKSNRRDKSDKYKSDRRDRSDHRFNNKTLLTDRSDESYFSSAKSIRVKSNRESSDRPHRSTRSNNSSNRRSNNSSNRKYRTSDRSTRSNKSLRDKSNRESSYRSSRNTDDHYRTRKFEHVLSSRKSYIERTDTDSTIYTSDDYDSNVSRNYENKALRNNDTWLNTVRDIQTKYPKFDLLSDEEKELFKIKLIGEYKRMATAYDGIVENIPSSDLKNMDLRELYMRQCFSVENIDKHQRVASYEHYVKMGLYICRVMSNYSGYDLTNQIEMISGNWESYKLSLLELASENQVEARVSPMHAIGINIIIDLILGTIATLIVKYLNVPDSIVPKLLKSMRESLPKPTATPSSSFQNDNDGIPIPQAPGLEGENSGGLAGGNSDNNPLGGLSGLLNMFTGGNKSEDGGVDINSLMDNLGPMISGFMNNMQNQGNNKDDGEYDL